MGRNQKKVIPQGIFEVYTDQKKRKLFTKSLLSSQKAEFGERIVREKDGPYREWDPKRSKLAAFIKNGCTNTGIRQGSVVLYLGASHGHTVSYVSDMIGKEGFVFALDFAARVVRDLVFVSERRENMAVIMADAMHPKEYVDRVSEVDVVFQDIAQREQAKIFLKNVKIFLKEGGVGLIAVKARSIDIKRRSSEIFEEVQQQIEKEFMITEIRSLEPFEKDHQMIVIKKAPPKASSAQIKKKESPRKKRNTRRRRK